MHRLFSLARPGHKARTARHLSSEISFPAQFYIAVISLTSVDPFHAVQPAAAIGLTLHLPFPYMTSVLACIFVYVAFFGVLCLCV